MSSLCDTSSLPDNQLQQELAVKTKQNPLPIHINNNQYPFQQWQKITENIKHWTIEEVKDHNVSIVQSIVCLASRQSVKSSLFPLNSFEG